ncbi:MAG TPA: phosphatase PAP2 family protein [Polyangia bacterium]
MTILRSLFHHVATRATPRWLAVVFVLTGSLWLFIELADEVNEQERMHEIDRRVLSAMREPGRPTDPWGPPWLEEVARDITGLGGITIVTLATLATVSYLAALRRSRDALVVLIAAGSGALFCWLLKLGFDRPRPDVVSRLSAVYSASFPSGHAMMSTVVYLTLGGLLAREESRNNGRFTVLAWVVFVCALVGMSRVYLGVHWPSDVLAGWAVGAFWALLCWSIAEWLDRRGVTDRPSR